MPEFERLREQATVKWVATAVVCQGEIDDARQQMIEAGERRRRAVLELRSIGLTAEEVGRVLGVSRGRVHSIIKDRAVDSVGA